MVFLLSAFIVWLNDNREIRRQDRKTARSAHALFKIKETKNESLWLTV